MKLYSRAWVRRVQKSDTLPTRSWHRGLTRLAPKQEWLRVVVPLVLAGVSHAAPWSQESLYLLTGWLLLLVLFRVSQLPDFLFFPRDAFPLLSLPVNDAFAFVFSRNRLIRRSLWVAIDVFAFFLGASGFHYFWLPIGQLAGVALLLWALHLSLAFLLTYFIWSTPERVQRYLNWGVLLSLLTLAIVVFGNLTEERKRSISPALAAANAIIKNRTPVGWSTSWARWSLAPGDFPAPPVATAAGLALLLFTAPWSYRALRRRFAFRGSEDAETLLFQTDEEATEDDRPPSSKEAPALVESIILSRDWLSLPDEKHLGWIERLIWKGFTPRQKTLAFDLAHRDANWSQLYRLSWASLATLSLVSWPVQLWYPPESIAWALGIGGFITLAMQFPIIGGSIAGMENSAFLSNGNTAFTSILPVGISELRSLFIRAAYFRHLPALPAFLWLGVLMAAFVADSWTAGLFPAFAFWLASLAIVPCWFIFKISPQTRDTRSSFWLTCSIFSGGLLGAGLLVTLFFACLNAPWWFSLIHLLVLALYVRGFEALYLRWYRRARFDLIATNESS